MSTTFVNPNRHTRKRPVDILFDTLFLRYAHGRTLLTLKKTCHFENFSRKLSSIIFQPLIKELFSKYNIIIRFQIAIPVFRDKLPTLILIHRWFKGDQTDSVSVCVCKSSSCRSDGDIYRRIYAKRAVDGRFGERIPKSSISQWWNGSDLVMVIYTVETFRWISCSRLRNYSGGC